MYRDGNTSLCSSLASWSQRKALTIPGLQKFLVKQKIEISPLEASIEGSIAARHDSVCLFTSSHGSHYMLCRNAQWIHLDSFSKKPIRRTRKRKKRSWTYFHSPAEPNCRRICDSGWWQQKCEVRCWHQRPTLALPTIICPSVFRLATGGYKYIITWEPATANHPIEGKLRTRQTSGPKSGILLRAIVYNVTYEAKTQDGFVSFCRASFDVVLISQLQCVKPDQSYTCPDGYNVGDMCSLNCKDGLVPTKFLTIICLPILQWSSNTLCEDKEKPVFLDCPTRALRIEERKNMTGRTLRVVDNVDTDLSVRLGPPDKSWYTRPRVEEIITATDRNENSAVCVITIDVKETLCGDREEALRKLNISDIVMLDGELAVCRIPGLEKKKMPMKCITDKVLNISSWEDEKLTLLCQDLDCRPKTPIKNSWIKYYEHIDGYFLDCDEGFYKPKLDSDYECSTRTSKRWRPTIPTNSTCTAGKVMKDFMFAVWLVYGSNACIEVNKTTMEKMSKTIIDLNLMDDVLKLFPQSFIGVTSVACLPPDSYYYLGVDRRRRATVLKRAPSKRISHGFNRVSRNNRTKRFKRLLHNKMATSQKEILVGPKRAYKYQIEVTITFKIDVTPDKHVPIMDDIDDLMYFFETSSNDKSFILKNSSQILDAKYLGSAASYVIKPCEVPLVYAMQYNFYLVCIGCGIGAVFTNDSRECAVCPLGTYQPLTEGSECLPCPPDWNTNNSGAGSLEECYANCGRGYYKTHRSHSCRPCPLGTYQPLEDGRVCLPCPDIWTSESPTECSGKLLCKRNYYSNTGHEPCIKCGLDQMTLAIGRKYCDATIKCSFGMANQITETRNHCEFYDVILNKDFIFYAFLGRSNNSIQAWFNFPHNLYNSQVVFSLGQEPGAAYFGCDDFTLSIYSAPADRVKIKKEWIHITIVVTWNETTLYVDGEIKEKKNFYSTKYCKVMRYTPSATFPALKMAALRLFEHEVFDEKEIKELASTCNISRNTLYYYSGQDVPQLALPTQCYVSSFCTTTTCNGHGSCRSLRDGYICQCWDKWSGVNCQGEPNYCKGHQCASGSTCINNVASRNYTCSCAQGFSGRLCGQSESLTTYNENQGCCFVSLFTEESCSCLHKCEALQTDSINMDNVTCTTDRDMDTMVCKINCRPGYMLDRDVQLICGLITDYTWSHVTKHNPLGWLPECVDASSVTLRTFKMEVRMKTRNITLVKAALQRNTHKLIFEKCRYCTKEVSIMNEEPLVVSIVVSATLPNILSSTATVEETRTVIQRMKEFDDVSSLLYLKSSEIFITNIDNKIVEVVLSTLDTSVSHICPVGTKFYHEVCVSCGRGTYWENGECKLCPIGYYQPSLRRSCCYLCPVGKSTAGLGARSELYCIAEPQSLYPLELGYWDDGDDKNVTAEKIVDVCPDAEPDEEGNLKIITIVAFLLVLAIICAAALCALRLRSKPPPPEVEKVPEAVIAATESRAPSLFGETTL